MLAAVTGFIARHGGLRSSRATQHGDLKFRPVLFSASR